MNAPLQFRATTLRERVIAEWDEKGERYDASTKPYVSQLPFIWEIVEAHPAAGITRTMAHAVLRAGQRLDFFAFGIGETVPTGLAGIAGASATRLANELDTNLSKGKKTNGESDFVFEAYSATASGQLVVYAAAQFPVGEPAIADPDVAAAYAGEATIYDPGALVVPSTFQSPFNLEDVLFEAMKGSIMVSERWGRKTFDELGVLSQIPEGASKSHLKSSGDARTDNRYKIPEGRAWKHTGDQTDTEFTLRLEVIEPVVVPIQLVSPGLLGVDYADLEVAQALPLPTRLIQRVTMRLHGLELSTPSENH